MGIYLLADKYGKVEGAEEVEFRPFLLRAQDVYSNTWGSIPNSLCPFHYPSA